LRAFPPFFINGKLLFSRLPPVIRALANFAKPNLGENRKVTVKM